MTVYYVMLLLLVAAGVIMCRNSKGENIYLACAGMVFFLVAAVRRFTGIDYNSYSTIYYNFNFMDYDDVSALRFEKGFIFPFKILSDLFQTPQIIIAVVAFIVAAALMIYTYKYSSIKWVSCAAIMTYGLYFYSLDFLRQIIAALIVTYALKYLNTNQYLRYIVLILFASTFHVSALIMLVFALILKIRMNYIILALYSTVTVLIMLFSENIMEFVTRYVYSNYDPKTSIEMTIGLPITYSIAYGIVFLLAFAFRKRLIERNSFNSIVINCMFFVTFFEIVGTKHAIISRLALLFIIAPTIILIPELVMVIKSWLEEKKKSTERRKKISVIAAYAVMSVFSVAVFQTFMIYDNNGIVPYDTLLLPLSEEDLSELAEYEVVSEEDAMEYDDIETISGDSLEDFFSSE